MHSSLGQLKNSATSSTAKAYGAKLMAVLIAHVKEGKEFPKDHSKQVEELQLHAAALPGELPDRQLLLDLSGLCNALASAAKG